MPFKWVEPEVFLVYDNVTVYHTYWDGDIGAEETYIFSTDVTQTNHNPQCDNLWEYQFDVRELNSWKTLTSQSHGKLRKPSAETAMIIKAIQNAILSGEIKSPPKPRVTKPKKAGKKKK